MRPDRPRRWSRASIIQNNPNLHTNHNLDPDIFTEKKTIKIY
jgi:hypothetical protein